MINDKAFWRQIAANDYAVPPSHSTASLTPFLLQTIGSPDPEWRDDIGYMTFVMWSDNHLYPADELRPLVAPLLANFHNGIGDRDTDSVCLRSFSALWLSVIVYRDNTEPFLDATTIHTLVDKSTAYLLAEQDIRGYVIGKGWLHAVAHTADLLCFLADNRHVEATHLAAILNAVVDKLSQISATSAYTHGEDQRLAKIVVSALKRELLDADYWQSWLQRLVDTRKQDFPDGLDVARYCTYQNIRSFLQAVYFSLAFADNPVPLGDTLQSDIQEALCIFGY